MSVSHQYTPARRYGPLQLLYAPTHNNRYRRLGPALSLVTFKGCATMKTQSTPQFPHDSEKAASPQAPGPIPLNFCIILSKDGRIDRLIDRPLEEYFAALPKASIAWIDYSTKTIPGRSSGSSRRPAAYHCSAQTALS